MQGTQVPGTIPYATEQLSPCSRPPPKKRMEEIQETFNKDLEEEKSKETMTNNTINEIKNSLEGMNSRITEAEEWISDLADKIVEITTAEQNKKKGMKRIEDSLRDL